MAKHIEQRYSIKSYAQMSMTPTANTEYHLSTSKSETSLVERKIL